MSLALKQKIKEAIDNSNDNELLSIVNTVIENYNKQSIVGYNPKGKAYTNKSLLEEIEKDSIEMDNGSFITSSEMKKRISDWK